MGNGVQVRWKTFFGMVVAAVLAGLSGAWAQDVNGPAIAAALGRPGTVMPGGVYRVGLPRTDLHVTLDGVALIPSFALGSYAAFKSEPEGTLVVGDLCLLESEIEPVMKSLESGGLRVTALHNHLRNEAPHVMFMHYMGVGDAAQLAAKLKAALSLSATPLLALAPATAAPPPPSFVAEVQDALQRQGTFAGGVLALSVGRREPITMMGMSVVPAMGVTNALNFQDAGNGNVATTGDFVLIASEVNSVEATLRSRGFEVTALHQHMIGDSPQLYYMHFWRVGPPGQVASALKEALSHINIAS